MIPTIREQKTANYGQVISAFSVANTYSEKKISAFEVSYVMSILFDVKKEIALNDYLVEVKLDKMRAERLVREGS